jgi:hypothetical protein
MTTITFVSLVAALGLAIVHLFSSRLRFLDGTPRSIWLSIAGGISVAYVFIHLLPELGEGQEVIRQAFVEAVGEGWTFLENHVYLVALFGLAVFYGLERAASSSPRHRREAGKADTTTAVGVFWLHVCSFALYNFIIGYLLLHRLATGFQDLALFFVAMALHFVVNDHGLREHHKEAYLRTGRWVLASAAVLGWVVAFLTEIPEAAIAVLTAFLAGGVVLNVLKEELPEERESRFWAFALGAAFYTVLLLAL